MPSLSSIGAHAQGSFVCKSLPLSDRQRLDAVPELFEDMQNDPYPSLAGELRDRDGYWHISARPQATRSAV